MFLPVVVLLFYLIKPKYRGYLLLAASYFFYMCWKPEYIILILLSTLTDYYCGRAIYKTTLLSKKKLLLFASLAVNLGLLFFFKYYNFVFDSFVSVFHTAGIIIESKTLDLLLPVGISFYTFQTLAYTIDIYRNKIKPEANISKFALYVAFFPQLVAGPIERAQNLLPQFAFKTKINPQNFVKGLRLILWGFFKKIVIADNLSIIVDQVYNNPLDQNGLTYFIATLFFAFQIYCDFSGYSDIAIGSARLIGVRLMLNFNVPYISASLKEFWSRWHISLSTWFRDYLYIPLGGNRKSKVRTLINLYLVFLISGLWHGANWTFVIWGAIHGIILVYEYLRRKQKKLPISKPIKQLFVFSVVLISWVYFRANNVSQANTIIFKHFIEIPLLVKSYFSGTSVLNGFGTISVSIIAKNILLLFLFFTIDVLKSTKGYIRLFVQNSWFRFASYFVLLYSIIFLGYFGETAFIYFQF